MCQVTPVSLPLLSRKTPSQSLLCSFGHLLMAVPATVHFLVMQYFPKHNTLSEQWGAGVGLYLCFSFPSCGSWGDRRGPHLPLGPQLATQPTLDPPFLQMCEVTSPLPMAGSCGCTCVHLSLSLMFSCDRGHCPGPLSMPVLWGRQEPTEPNLDFLRRDLAPRNSYCTGVGAQDTMAVGRSWTTRSAGVSRTHKKGSF